jgi:hypothetical protein
MNLRTLNEVEVYNIAIVDTEFTSFMTRHEPAWEDNLFMSDVALAYKIWYHAKTYKPDLLNPTRLKEGE